MDKHLAGQCVLQAEKDSLMQKTSTVLFIKILSAVCLCLMLAHQAEAGSIVWSGVQDISIPWFPLHTAMIDVDSNGSDDFMIRNEGGFNMKAYSLVDGNEFFDEITTVGHAPNTVPSSFGTIFDDTPTSPNIWYDNPDDHSQIMMSQGTGFWVGADHQYMGVRFQGDAGMLYGWMEISLASEMPLDMTIHSWAYNSVPGEGLVAGVVPEPSSIALLLCGCITLLVRLRRNFRLRANI